MGLTSRPPLDRIVGHRALTLASAKKPSVRVVVCPYSVYGSPLRSAKRLVLHCWGRSALRASSTSLLWSVFVMNFTSYCDLCAFVMHFGT